VFPLDNVTETKHSVTAQNKMSDYLCKCTVIYISQKPRVLTV